MREPSPEAIPEPAPVPELSPEPVREPSPESIPVREPEEELAMEPSAPIEPKPPAVEPQQAWGEEPIIEQMAAPQQQAPAPDVFNIMNQSLVDFPADKEEPAAESVPEFDPFAAPPVQQSLFGAGDEPPEKPKQMFGDIEKDVDTAADDINANEALLKEPAPPVAADVFGGAAPEGLPSPPEPQSKAFEDESDNDRLEF